MESRTVIIPVKLTSGKVIQVEATDLGGEQDVTSRLLSFEEVTDVVEEISKAVVTSLTKIKPRKASVEFGLEVATESGQLTALLVKGTGKGTLKITLEWGEEK